MTSSKGKTYKEALQDRLRKEILNITFEKVNGETRVMRCTLMPEYLTEATILGDKKDTGLSRNNTDVVAVWDLDNSGWRSMRVESITDVRRA